MSICRARCEINCECDEIIEARGGKSRRSLAGSRKQTTPNLHQQPHCFNLTSAPNPWSTSLMCDSTFYIKTRLYAKFLETSPIACSCSHTRWCPAASTSRHKTVWSSQRMGFRMFLSGQKATELSKPAFPRCRISCSIEAHDWNSLAAVPAAGMTYSGRGFAWELGV